MRKKIILPFYEKNKKIREEMKELVKQGRKLLQGEKDLIRRQII